MKSWCTEHRLSLESYGNPVGVLSHNPSKNATHRFEGDLPQLLDAIDVDDDVVVRPAVEDARRSVACSRQSILRPVQHNATADTCPHSDVLCLHRHRVRNSPPSTTTAAALTSAESTAPAVALRSSLGLSVVPAHAAAHEAAQSGCERTSPVRSSIHTFPWTLNGLLTVNEAMLIDL